MSTRSGDWEEGEKGGGLGREVKGRLLWETPVVHFFWHWHPQCFILLGYDIIWIKHLDFTICGKQSNNLLSLNHADKRPLLVIVHVLTVDSIRNWWAEYKNTGSYSRCSLPFSLSRFSPSSLPFLHLPRMLNKRSLCYLSLVFICWENPRRSGILLFRDCPRFCWLMKTRNRRYRRYHLGWTGTIWRIRSVYIFPTRPRFVWWSVIIPDKWKVKFALSGTWAMNFAHYQSPKLLGSSPLSHINMASLGQTCGDYPIYRQNLGRSAKSKIPDRLGFFPTYENQALMI